MQIPWKKKRNRNFGQKTAQELDWRLKIVLGGFLLFGVLVIGKLFDIQILKFDFYYALASDQHEIFQQLFPERGEIYVEDEIIPGSEQTNLYPLAINKEYYLVYAQPKFMEDPEFVAEQLAPLVKKEKEELLSMFSKEDDPYEPIQNKVEPALKEQIHALNLSGIRFAPETYRYYPEHELASHVLGFVSQRDAQKIGQYGIEGYFNSELSGQQGSVVSETDTAGRWITVADKDFQKAVDGNDIILTIDRTLQSEVCRVLREDAERFNAKSGAVIILEPETGAVKAMCSWPEFDPNEYNKVEDVWVYNNTAIYGAYEPGSVFKPVTMAAAIDSGAVTPDTTYEDLGEREIDDFTIRNSDLEAHGVQTMTQVLEKSLNLGTIFAVEQMGKRTFKKYVEAFGFGEPTNISLDTESSGTIASLDKRGDIYAATASFGQGITVTPIQMVRAINAIANNGKMVEPYIVSAERTDSGEMIPHVPEKVSQVVSSRTATLLSGMLTAVVESGHGGLAKVPGYYIAGKTGTAQIAKPGGGYDEHKTNHSFVGFGPVEDPAFTMIVKYEEPTNGAFSSSTAADTFGRIADFVLDYYHIPPNR